MEVYLNPFDSFSVVIWGAVRFIDRSGLRVTGGNQYFLCQNRKEKCFLLNLQRKYEIISELIDTCRKKPQTNITVVSPDRA